MLLKSAPICDKILTVILFPNLETKDFIMKAKDLFLFFLKRGAVLYTAISLPLFIILSIISSDSTLPIAPEKILLVALLAFIMALGSTLYRIESISTAVARAIHAACYILGFFAFIFLTLADLGAEKPDFTQDLTSTLVATAIFAIIYAAVCIIFSVLKKKTSIFSLSTPKPVQANPKTNQSTKNNDTNKKSEKNAPHAKKSKREDDTYTSRFS